MQVLQANIFLFHLIAPKQCHGDIQQSFLAVNQAAMRSPLDTLRTF